MKRETISLSRKLNITKYYLNIYIEIYKSNHTTTLQIPTNFLKQIDKLIIKLILR